MPEYISNNLTTIIVALIGVVVGGIAISLVIKSKRVKKTHSVKQSGNLVGGDQAGGDINKFNSK
jgi:hypothetical protein